jgi:hypothetical protein
LSAYHLSGRDPIYLEKAKELGDRILPTFDTPSGLPLSQVNLGLRKGIYDPDYPGLVSTAEVSTLQLEFRYLAYLTDDDIYWEKAEHVRISLDLLLYIPKSDIYPPGHGGHQSCAYVPWAGIYFHEVSQSSCCLLSSNWCIVPMKANLRRLQSVWALVETLTTNIYCEPRNPSSLRLFTLAPQKTIPADGQ